MGRNISFFLWRRNETVWWYSGYKSAYRRRGLRFDPGSGKIPHAVEQLNPCATTIEPALQSLCFTAREATAMRNPCISTKSSPHLVQIEKARVHQQRPSVTKKKKKETGWLCETVPQTLDLIPRNFAYWIWIFSQFAGVGCVHGVVVGPKMCRCPLHP